jgi:hypothetical protein
MQHNNRCLSPVSRFPLRSAPVITTTVPCPGMNHRKKRFKGWGIAFAPTESPGS